MDFPRLNKDESLIRKSSGISIKKKPYTVYLTPVRLIIADVRNQPPFQKEIPLEEIHALEPGENKEVEPTIKMAVTAPDGELRTMILTFTQNLGEYRIQERDGWLAAIRHQMATFAAPPSVEQTPDIPSKVDTGGEILDVEGNEHYVDEVKAVSIKSQQYLVQLTNSRVVLLDENQIPPVPKYVDMQEIIEAEAGCTPRNDPTIVLTVDKDGGARKMVLIFSQEIGEIRSGERDRFLTSLLSLKFPHQTPGDTSVLKKPETASEIIPPAVSEAKSMGYCPQCGAQVIEESKFCHSCGQKIMVQDAWIVPETPVESSPPPAREVVRERRQKPRREKVKRVRKKQVSLGNFSIIGKFTRFIVAPSEGYMVSKGDSLGEAVVYCAMILALFSVVNSIVISYIGSLVDPIRYPILADIAGSGVGGTATLLVELFIFAMIGLIGISCLCHIGVMMIGGKHRLVDTIKAVMYGSTPFAVAGIIPIIGLIPALVWTALLQIIGIREYQDISTGGAVIAMGIGIGLCVIVLLILEGIGISIVEFL